MHRKSLTANLGLEPTEQEIEYGFVRLGFENSPFLLIGGEEVRQEAKKIHESRSEDIREQDERGNEPLTLELDDWEEELLELDFPYVDTIPLPLYKERAEDLLTNSMEENIVDDIRRDCEMEFCWGECEERVIKLSQEEGEFPNEKHGFTLVHEIGHAIYNTYLPEDVATDEEIGTHDRYIFDTRSLEEDAKTLSSRMRGSIPHFDKNPGLAHYRLNESELFADCYASRAIEPDAAQRTAPIAVGAVEDVVNDISSDLLPKYDTLDNSA